VPFPNIKIDVGALVKRVLLILVTILLPTLSLSSEPGETRCGTSTIGELFAKGWRIEKQDYIRSLGEHGKSIELEDGTIYNADMTSGMFVGDRAILMSKYVRSDKAEGYIFNICAGGFDAWVTPFK